MSVSVPEQLFTKLTADTNVTALVATRIYPDYDLAADNTYPLCVYQTENVSPVIAHDGPTGLESCDYRIAALATTYKQADTIARAIITSLAGYRVKNGDTFIQGVFLKDDGIRDDKVTDPTTERVLYHVKELTFQVWYSLT